MKRAIPLAVLAALTLACSSVRVDSDYDRAGKFDSYRNWNWIPREAMVVKDQQAYSELTDRRIRAAIARQLEGKGLTRVQGEGELIVAYQVGIREKMEIYDTGWGSGYGYGYGYRRGYWRTGRIESRQWTEGTLIVDLIDREAKHLVWRGKAVGVVGDYETQEQRINEALAEMFKLYPPDVAK
jgi:hypothetical protein